MLSTRCLRPLVNIFRSSLAVYFPNCLAFQRFCSKSPVKIYTKTGDKGTSSTFTGEIRQKDDPIFESLGSVDELSSAIGLAREFCEEAGHPFSQQLTEIQSILQDLASCVATPLGSASKAHLARTRFNEGHIQDLELWIDEHTEQLPQLKNFILPGGGKSSAALHVARASCRTAERRLVRVVRDGEADPATLRFLNRLGDFLFTLARVACKSESRTETVYVRPRVSKGPPDRTPSE